MIEVKNLTKNFRVHKKTPGLMGSIKALYKRDWVEKKAVNSVNFSVGAGEIVGLVGANGAGKTTLVKMLAGIIHPSSGEANVLGHTPWNREIEFRKMIALIMGQKAQLWWDLPAADCFLLLREIYQVPKKKYEERLEYLSTTLGIKDQLQIQIRRLSLGERMKMELMAALLHEPQVVYLDEPTIGLDLTAQKAIRKFILDYRKSHQPAMILTSHYMADIEKLCERIIIIRDGDFVYDGSLDVVRDKYIKHKILNARLRPDEKITSELKERFSKIGEVSHYEDDQLKIKVDRDQVAAAAGAVLQAHKVIDITIEEEEIADTIEKLLHRGEI